MRHLYQILVLSLVMAQGVAGQVNKFGVPLTIHYFEPDEIFGAEQSWAVTQDERGIIFVGTNDRGILQYDGNVWLSIPMPNDAAVRVLKRGSDGRIYVGAQGDFGYLTPGPSGMLEFVSIISKVDLFSTASFRC